MSAAEWSHSFSIRVPAPVHADMMRVVRITGLSIAEFTSRAIEDAVDRAASDPDVGAALEAIRRIDQRVSGAPPSAPPEVDTKRSDYPGSLSESGSPGEQARARPEGVDDSQSVPGRTRSAAVVPGECEPTPPVGLSAPAWPEDFRSIPDAPARSKSGTHKEQPAKVVGEPERPASRASRSEGIRQPETRAPAKGSDSPSPAHSVSLGSRLRAAREARGLSQAAVAAAVDCSGAMVGMIETGRSGGGPALVDRIEAWIAKPPTLKRPNTKINMRGKAKVTPSAANRAPDPSQSLPRVLPADLETFPCVALNSPKMTERTCAANKARAKGDAWLETTCTDCPGVRALAKAKAKVGG